MFDQPTHRGGGGPYGRGAKDGRTAAIKVNIRQRERWIYRHAEFLAGLPGHSALLREAARLCLYAPDAMRQAFALLRERKSFRLIVVEDDEG